MYRILPTTFPIMNQNARQNPPALDRPIAVVIDYDEEEDEPKQTTTISGSSSSSPFLKTPTARKVSDPATSGGRRDPSQETGARAGSASGGCAICEHHIVLRMSDLDAHFRETRGTLLLHEVFGDHPNADFSTMLDLVLQAIHEEFVFYFKIKEEYGYRFFYRIIVCKCLRM